MTTHLLEVEAQFDVINIKPEFISCVLQSFIKHGSRSKRLTKSMIKVYEPLPGRNYNTLADYLDQGNCLFDTIVYLQLDHDAKPLLHPRVDGMFIPDNNAECIAQCVFLVYFYLFTQGDLPDIYSGRDRRPMPNFLTNVLKYDHSADWYIRNISSFDLRLMEHRWVMDIDIDGMSIEAKNRFALGLAGYRHFQPFHFLIPRPGISDIVTRAYTIVTRFLARGKFWDIHPMFRTPEMISRMGTLNGALDNLMIACFTREELTNLVDAKVLYEYPIYNIRNNTYATWDEHTFDFCTLKVFANTL